MRPSRMRWTPSSILLTICTLLCIFLVFRSPRHGRHERDLIRGPGGNISVLYHNTQKRIIASYVTRDKLRWSSVVLRHIRIPVDRTWGGNIIAILAALYASEGPILELGSCFNSTPFVHNVAKELGRYILTVDSDPHALYQFLVLQNPAHAFGYIHKHAVKFPEYLEVPVHFRNWQEVGRDWRWGLVLVDCKPTKYRWPDILQFKNKTDGLVITDLEQRFDNIVEADDILGMFPYRYHYRKKEVSSVVTDVWSVSDHQLIAKVKRLVCWTIEIVKGESTRPDESEC